MSVSNIKIEQFINKFEKGEIGGNVEPFIHTYQLNDYVKETDEENIDWYCVTIEHNKNTLTPICKAYNEENKQQALSNFEIVDENTCKYYTMKKFVLTVSIL